MNTPANHQQLTSAAETTIVAFHIGRGGHFHNPGYCTFLGEHKISKYTDDLFLNYDLSDIMDRLEKENEDWDNGDTGYHAKVHMTKKDVFFSLVNDENFEEIEKRYGVKQEELGDKYYFDGGGNHVGLTEKEAESGIGTINIDHDYDTTYTCKLSECDDKELQKIYDSNEFRWMDDYSQEYIKWMLDIEEADEIEE